MDHLTMLELLEYKRFVAEMYARVRSNPDPEDAWKRWRAEREDLFASHPQSALPEEERGTKPLGYFPYDPDFRALAELEAAEPKSYDIGSSDGGTMAFTRTAIARFTLNSAACELECYWLEGYGGGLFVPFRDETSGDETYGGGRYILDTVKGADLGVSEPVSKLVLDFNFAYNPSCSYDPRWACPLAPLPNHLKTAIRAGEKHLR